MYYLTSSELKVLHEAFLEKLEKKASDKNEAEWGFPSGVIACDTYQCNTKRGILNIGHYENVEMDRWWIPLALDSQVEGYQLPVIFEMNIPKQRNLMISVHYVMDDQGAVHILHKGKFTVGHGSLSMDQFFSYYKNNPGQWSLNKINWYDYLELAKVSLRTSDNEFTALLDSLAEFASYVPNYKNNYR